MTTPTTTPTAAVAMQTAKKTFTVQVWDTTRIAWCKAHPNMLSRRQRRNARIMPETFGAGPLMVFTGRQSLADAERDALPYRRTHLVVIS